LTLRSKYREAEKSSRQKYKKTPEINGKTKRKKPRKNVKQPENPENYIKTNKQNRTTKLGQTRQKAKKKLAGAGLSYSFQLPCTAKQRRTVQNCSFSRGSRRKSKKCL